MTPQSLGILIKAYQQEGRWGRFPWKAVCDGAASMVPLGFLSACSGLKTRTRKAKAGPAFRELGVCSGDRCVGINQMFTQTGSRLPLQSSWGQ